MWVSESIPGEIQGKALSTQNGPNAGEYMFFTHNQNLMTADPFGSFSSVLAETGALVFTEISGESQFDPEADTLARLESLRLPYGPLGVAYGPEYGRYPGGEGNSNDLFIWSTSVEDGKGPNGYTRAFQLPRLFTPDYARKFSFKSYDLVYFLTRKRKPSHRCCIS